MFRRVGASRIELVRGDITRQEVDAVVNAANDRLAGGGGVDGAIHRAAGPELKAETDRRYPAGCPTGSAVATRGGKLKAKFVFHAVGPVWRGGAAGEDALLRSAVTACLDLAEAHGCRSIALPALSTGAYGYPLDRAAEAILAVIRDRLGKPGGPEVVRVVLFDEAAYGQFARVLESIGDGTENRP